MAISKFTRQLVNSATFTCKCCGKRTRETGHHEAAVEMCKKCLFEAYVENAASDYGEDSDEYREALENLKGLK